MPAAIQPADAAHDFDDAAGAVIRRHAGDIEANFDDSRGVVLDHRAVAGAVVGVRQIVIDGLGHADHPHFVVAFDGFLMNFVGRVLRIVAADVKEIADVVGLKNFEQPVHILRGLFGLLLEIDLVTAGAQRGGGRVSQALDRFGFLLIDVDELLVEDAEDAVERRRKFPRCIRACRLPG